MIYILGFTGTIEYAPELGYWVYFFYDKKKKVSHTYVCSYISRYFFHKDCLFDVAAQYNMGTNHFGVFPYFKTKEELSQFIFLLNSKYPKNTTFISLKELNYRTI